MQVHRIVHVAMVLDEDPRLIFQTLGIKSFDELIQIYFAIFFIVACVFERILHSCSVQAFLCATFQKWVVLLIDIMAKIIDL